MYYVYILYSKVLNKYYTGYSSNVDERIVYHNSGRNIIWTKRGKPWEKFHIISGLTKRQAILIERHIKKMKSRKYIEELSKSPEMVEMLKMRYFQSG